MKISIKQVLAVISVIILGAIGSGVWDIFFKPIFKIFSGQILTIITFGIQSQKDNIYLEVAKGFHESSTILLFGILTGIFTGLVIGSLTFIQIPQKNATEDKNILEKKIEKI